MNEHFLKFKRHLGRRALLWGSLYGLSAGLLGAAIILLCGKLGLLSASPALAGAVGGGLALAVGLLLYFLLRPGDRKTARQVDDTLLLKEKVQTMLDFADATGEIVEIQRADAQETLSVASVKAMRPRRIWLHSILPLVAAAAMTVSLILPAYTEAPPDLPSDPEPEVEAFALTAWHIARVNELIAHVEASELDETGKPQVVGLLQDLLAALAPVVTRPAMVETVTTAMVKINGVTDSINTYTPIVRALATGDARVKAFAEAIGYPADPIAESKWQAFRVAFPAEDRGESSTGFASALNIALGSLTLPAEDPLLAALQTFAAGMKSYAADTAGLDAAAAEARFAALFEDGATAIAAALSAQYANRAETDYVNDGLMETFGISFSELPDALKTPDTAEVKKENGEYEEKDDETVVGGGYGKGETIYGSDDAIYDGESDTHRAYGEVLNYYDALKSDEVTDRALEEEIKDFIDHYFAALYGNVGKN